MRPILGITVVVLVYLVHFGNIFVAAQVALSRNWLRGKFSNEKTEMRIARAMGDGQANSWALFAQQPKVELRNSFQRRAVFFSPEETTKRKIVNGLSQSPCWLCYKRPLSLHSWALAKGMV
ncbi:unnamed protein product [Allacma fusca]|uniref:Uncharacterized protein n=1 Tax=Allacma fusca TaxID=39272 RepID=A0A8J2KZU1_9HEXA|nr:unnamed protein product [Allacma fusca]